MLAEHRSVSRVFHPSPVGEYLHLGDGVHAAVQTGSASYQLSTGEMVEMPADPKADGDAHIKAIKSAIKSAFPLVEN